MIYNIKFEVFRLILNSQLYKKLKYGQECIDKKVGLRLCKKFIDLIEDELAYENTSFMFDVNNISNVWAKILFLIYVKMIFTLIKFMFILQLTKRTERADVS